MYELGELWMYQRDGVNPSGCLLMAAAFTSNDWSVLRLMMLDRKDSDTDEEEEDNSPPSPKQSKMDDEQSSAEPMEPPKSGTTFSALWQTKSSSSDHWFFRVSVHRPKEDEAFFRLESFNSSCGVYRTMFEVPFNFWQEKILEVEAEITELFHSCCDWSDKMVVKKALQF
ncbi:hypothetical protein FQA47_020307 [Oryzias melastigma]|uniref:Uncharacterized protein n=1 Tax=Oryzias melastigma TaxID=30732 RepID=A0A834KYY4_ORYME|nr:hypothetical protein FQA47_020307 [Oryzias melastigma]